MTWFKRKNKLLRKNPKPGDSSQKKQITDKNFKTLIKHFVDLYENKGVINEKLKNKILEQATIGNKKEIMEDLISRIEVFRDYDENIHRIDFPYLPYVKKFLE